MTRVLVTRLEADGKQTASRLIEAGFDPVLLPLTELRPIVFPVMQGRPDFVLFTSAHAVELVGSAEAAGFSELPAYAVGPRTAKALREKAYNNIRIGRGTASGLAERVIQEQGGRNSCGWYYCGRERAFDFTAAFEGSRISLELCEVYVIVDREPVPETILAAFEAARKGAALVYSAAGARRLVEVSKNYDFHSVIREMTAIVISDNAASAIPEMTFRAVEIADKPTEAGLVAMLERRFG